MRRDPNSRFLFLTRLSVVACAAVLAGCVNFETILPGEEGTSAAGDGARTLSRDEILMAQTPPRYSVGDQYQFDNPDVTWQVVAIRGEEVDWISTGGERQTTANNPLMPALSWSSAARGSGKRLISAAEGALFPLAVGNRMRFRTTVSTDQPPYAWEFDWSCSVLGEAFLPAWESNKEIHTYEVQCGRQRPDELTFYYAPMVGHYVRMIASTEGEAGQESASAAIIRNLTNFSRTVQTAEGSRKITAASLGLASMPSTPEALANAQRVTSDVINPSDPATSITIDERGQPKPADQQQVVQQVNNLPSTIADAVAAAVQEPLETSDIQMSSAAASQAIRGPVVHLASYRKPESAEAGWRAISAKLGSTLQGLKPIVRRVDLGSKGIYYRLHAGMLGNVSEAAALCQRLKSSGVYCKAETL